MCVCVCVCVCMCWMSDLTAKSMAQCQIVDDSCVRSPDYCCADPRACHLWGSVPPPACPTRCFLCSPPPLFWRGPFGLDRISSTIERLSRCRICVCVCVCVRVCVCVCVCHCVYHMPNLCPRGQGASAPACLGPTPGMLGGPWVPSGAVGRQRHVKFMPEGPFSRVWVRLGCESVAHPGMPLLPVPPSLPRPSCVGCLVPLEPFVWWSLFGPRRQLFFWGSCRPGRTSKPFSESKNQDEGSAQCPAGPGYSPMRRCVRQVQAIGGASDAGRAPCRYFLFG